MTDNNLTFGILLVDRSASMESMRAEAQASINQFMVDQAEGEGRMIVSLYDFDNLTNVESPLLQPMSIHGINHTGIHYNTKPRFHHVFGPVDPKNAPSYELLPKTGTPLIDAMYGVIEHAGNWLNSLPEVMRPGRIVFATITDGEELHSTLYTAAQLKAVIQRQTDMYKWDFVFMGANLDAFGAASEYGVQNVVQYKNTGASYAGAYNTFSNTLLAARAGGASYTSKATNTTIDENGNPVA